MTAAPAPRVVFGMPAYGRADALPRTLESLLAQTVRDFAIVIVDDAPSPEVAAIVARYAAIDARVTYEPNATRLGMVGNWRHAFSRARALHPGSEYFAWVSDHDVWHPRWLEALLPALEADDDVVMAYPHAVRLLPQARRRFEGTFDTGGTADRSDRLRGTMTQMTAGNAIYGLFRIDALKRVGVFRPVLLPDRLVLSALSLLGTFRHVDEMLWYREASSLFTYDRQRATLFGGRAPLYTWLPVDLQHLALLIWDFAVRGQGRPAFGRLAGLGHALAFFWYSVSRREARWRETIVRATQHS